MSHKIQKVCLGALGVVAFYAVFAALGYLFSPLFYELYVYTPFILFALVTFFFTLFLCRETACLIFMPKPKLKAILRDGQPEITASQAVVRFFSWPFLKRIATYFSLFVLELVCRLLAIRIFLAFISWSISFWEKVSGVSNMLLVVLLTLVGFLIMELPWYELFYKYSFQGRPNRSNEYRFGLKAFILVLGILIIQMAFYPVSMHFESNAGQIGMILVVALLALGLWYLMYVKKWTCSCGCPICNKVRNWFRCAGDSDEQCAIKVVQSILDAQGQEMAREESQLVQSIVEGEKKKEEEEEEEEEKKNAE